jgi:hypothetical protein
MSIEKDMRMSGADTERLKSKEYVEQDGDLQVRMDMAREFKDLGLESEAFERILSIRIRAEGKEE